MNTYRSLRGLSRTWAVVIIAVLVIAAGVWAAYLLSPKPAPGKPAPELGALFRR